MIEVKIYERFGELRVQKNSLAPTSHARVSDCVTILWLMLGQNMKLFIVKHFQGSYKNVQPGDCIVAFTRPGET